MNKTISQLPADWSYKSLREIASNEKYSIAGGPFGSNLKRKDYREKGVRIILLQNIGDGFFEDSYFEYTSEEKADELIASNIYPGEIILSKMGDPVARAAIVPDFDNRYVMCSDGIRFVPDVSNDKLFIFYAINSDSFRKQAISNSTGTTRKRISLGDLKNCKIFLPPLPQQQKIAQILSTVDDEIAKTNAIIEQTKTLKAGLMQQLFTKGICHTKFKKTKLGMIPEGWEILNLSDVCKNFDNKRIPITKNKRKKGKYPYYGASGVIDYVSDYIFDEELLLIGEDGANLVTRSLPIAFSIRGKTWVNNHAHVLNFESIVTQRYVEFYINQISLEKYLTGTAQPKLNQVKLNMIEIPLPPTEEQTKIVSILSSIDEKVSIDREIKNQLTKLKKGLMQDLLSGKGIVN